MSPKFKPGDEVQSVPNPNQIGVIVKISEFHAGIQYYIVRFGSSRRTTVSEADIRPYIPEETPCDKLELGKIDGYQAFQRLITYQRLIRDHPLRNNIYAFNASRTRFYPYQFKPLFCFGSAKFGQMSAFLKLQIICDNLKLGELHDNQSKVQNFA